MTTVALAPTAVVTQETSIGDQPDLYDLWIRFRASDTSVLRGKQSRDLMERIAVASALACRENWDGEGARPVGASTVWWAELFAASIPMTLPRPEVSADADGDMGFEWYFAPDRVVTVSVRQDGAISYAALVGTSRANGWANLTSGAPSEIFDWVARAIAR